MKPNHYLAMGQFGTPLALSQSWWLQTMYVSPWDTGLPELETMMWVLKQVEMIVGRRPGRLLSTSEASDTPVHQ
jgi:hypothetical protein